jgi:histidinol-phosphatase
MMNERLTFALSATYEAGQSTLGLFNRAIKPDLKEDQTPVTEADRGAEEIIRHLIEKQYPGETVFGEEQGLTGHSDQRWVIDPIDGTKSFVAGVPLYATLLSYEEAGEVQVACCFIPTLGEMYYASKGGGAFLNGRAIRARQNADLTDALLLNGSFKSLEKYSRLGGWMKLASQARMTRGWSDAYGHMLVARGTADIMIDPVVSHWDVSAPSLIVREAGASFSDFAGGLALTSEAISTTIELRDEVLAAFATEKP